MLLGEYELRIDDKNRITVPARLRPAFEDGVFVTRGLDSCLIVFTRDGWDVFVEAQSVRIDSLTREGRQMERYLFGAALEGELDRQGRIALPPALLKHAALDRDIVILGVRDRLEIWDRDAWQSEFTETEGGMADVAERVARESHR